MHHHQTFTPLPGLRALSRAAVAAQARIDADPSAALSASRSELLAAVASAAAVFKLSGSLLSVLEKLASCFNAPVKGRCIVWPSNQWLAARTNIDERTIRRHLARLLALGLFVHNDSARRHRYPVHNRAGEIVAAFGVDLTPLWLRRDELLALARAQADVAAVVRHADHDLSCLRLAIHSALEACRSYDLADRRASLGGRLADILKTCPRKGQPGQREGIIAALVTLRTKAKTLFYELTAPRPEDVDSTPLNDENVRLSEVPASANIKINCYSTESSNAPCLKSETSAPRKAGRAFGARSSDKEVGNGVRCNERGGNREIPLALIHQACPSLAEFCGIVSSQTDIIEAGKTLRPSFGASPDAWNEGVRLIGQYRAAILSIYVHQLACDDEQKNGPRGRETRGKFGGIFRSLIRHISDDQIDIFQLLAAARRKKIL